MGRVSLQARLSVDFDQLAGAANVADVSALYSAALDNVYYALGFGDADLPDPALLPAQAADAPLLAEYYTLRSIARNAAALVDVTTGPEKQLLSQVYTQVALLLEQANAAIEARGYGMADLITMGRLNLDFLEPGPYLGADA